MAATGFPCAECTGQGRTSARLSGGQNDGVRSRTCPGEPFVCVSVCDGKLIDLNPLDSLQSTETSFPVDAPGKHLFRPVKALYGSWVPLTWPPSSLVASSLRGVRSSRGCDRRRHLLPGGLVAVAGTGDSGTEFVRRDAAGGFQAGLGTSPKYMKN